MKLENIILFDLESDWKNLLPLTYTRPISEIRAGITTIKEKWSRFAETISYRTQGYLSEKYPENLSAESVFINATVIPTEQLVNAILSLDKNQALVSDNKLIAVNSNTINPETFTSQNTINFEGELLAINFPWDIFELAKTLISIDFAAITLGRKSANISQTNRIIHPEKIFIEEGAVVEFAMLNASEGPIYIGKHAEIMEGAMIRGPLVLCEHSTIKMGAKIYGATTIGPWCKVAGEVQNSVIFGYSNKGHDGYLGNAVIGEWCNIGADSNNSNLKNNYAIVKLWNYRAERFIDTGLQFCGLIMGDHSKCGINTMFNTGTVVGVSANIFGSGFPRNFIPSFSWGGASGFSTYNIKQAVETAQTVMKRRKIELDNKDLTILQNVFNLSEKYRK